MRLPRQTNHIFFGSGQQKRATTRKIADFRDPGALKTTAPFFLPSAFGRGDCVSTRKFEGTIAASAPAPFKPDGAPSGRARARRRRASGGRSSAIRSAICRRDSAESLNAALIAPIVPAGARARQLGARQRSAIPAESVLFTLGRCPPDGASPAPAVPSQIERASKNNKRPMRVTKPISAWRAPAVGQQAPHCLCKRTVQRKAYLPRITNHSTAPRLNESRVISDGRERRIGIAASVTRNAESLGASCGTVSRSLSFRC